MKKSEVAEVLAQHQRAKFAFESWGYGRVYDCECGLRFRDPADHQADMLEKAGLCFE